MWGRDKGSQCGNRDIIGTLGTRLKNQMDKNMQNNMEAVVWSWNPKP